MEADKLLPDEAKIEEEIDLFRSISNEKQDRINRIVHQCVKNQLLDKDSVLRVISSLDKK